MRYIIISVLKNHAGKFNNNLRKDIFEKFDIKSSKLPAHFTIKSPFSSKDITSLENTLKYFCENQKCTSYKIKGYDYFDDRVIYMKVFMSTESKIVHDNLIDELSNFDYINFLNHDGKNKIFHVTISSKKLNNKFNILWNYVNDIPCYFNCNFDNICIYKWIDNSWKLHKEYLLK